MAPDVKFVLLFVLVSISIANCYGRVDWKAKRVSLDYSDVYDDGIVDEIFGPRQGSYSQQQSSAVGCHLKSQNASFQGEQKSLDFFSFSSTTCRLWISSAGGISKVTIHRKRGSSEFSGLPTAARPTTTRTGGSWTWRRERRKHPRYKVTRATKKWKRWVVPGLKTMYNDGSGASCDRLKEYLRWHADRNREGPCSAGGVLVLHGVPRLRVRSLLPMWWGRSHPNWWGRPYWHQIRGRPRSVLKLFVCMPAAYNLACMRCNRSIYRVRQSKWQFSKK